MNFKDRAIILSKTPLKEKSYIIKLFTEKHGVYSGVLKQYSKKMGDSLAPGNLVDFFWNSRLSEHIGTAKAELLRTYNAHLMLDKYKLFAFNSITSLLKIAFYEREPHNNLFPELLKFMDSLKNDFSFKKYMEIELAILKEAGYQLQLNSCVATGAISNLKYVSPKSGCAVSAEAGAKYADKLLKLPEFLINEKLPCKHSIPEAFQLTSYFFERYILINKPLPSARDDFSILMQKN